MNVSQETIMKHQHRKPGKCACGKGPKRPGQGNCHACHAKANEAYRLRRKVELEKLERANFGQVMQRIRRSVEGAT